MNRPWHGHYYHQMYGQPLALVVPPTASMRQTFSWGVSQNLMYPLYHQYRAECEFARGRGSRKLLWDAPVAQPHRSVWRLLRTWALVTIHRPVRRCRGVPDRKCNEKPFGFPWDQAAFFVHRSRLCSDACVIRFGGLGSCCAFCLS